jgi:hypothetical protein
MAKHCTHTFRKIVSTHKWQSKDLITYWLRCKSCGHKWKVYYDPAKQQEIQPKRDAMPPSQRRLTDLEVRLVLLDPRSTALVAKDLGVSHQAVGYIRTGVYRADVWPDIPRQPRQNVVRRTDAHGCKSCTYWDKGACSFDLPEAGMPGFAEECNYFTQSN